MDPLFIGLTLHYCDIQVGNNSLEEKLYQTIPAKGLSRDSAIDEADRDPPPPALTQKIRPKFGLHYQHGNGINVCQRTPDRPAPIKRKIEDIVRFVSKNFSRQSLSR